MNRPTRSLRIYGAALLLGAAASIGPARLAAQIPDEFTNLKVLPEDIGRRELIGTMRGFTFSLGVRCTYCHVGEEGQPLSEYDFASDEKEKKRTARFMLQMMADLNEETLPGISEVSTRADPPIRVRCVTCHRGVSIPRQISEVVLIAAEDGGGEAAISKYRELRDEYYGRGSYDFGEGPLIQIAGGLMENDDGEGALAVFGLALEYYPESLQAWVGKAQVHIAREENDEARAALLKAQELAPDAPQIRRMLQQLEGGS